MLSPFSHSCWPFVCLLWKIFRFFAHFLLFLINYSVIELYDFFYDLDINLSDIWLENIFSYFTFSFCWSYPLLYRIFQFDVVQLILVFLAWVSAVKLKTNKQNTKNKKTKHTHTQNIAKTNDKELSPMFSSKSFMVSGLIFKSWIHFVFFLVWCKIRLQFYSFHANIQFSQPICWLRMYVFPLCILSAFVKDYMPIYACVYF